MTLLAPLSLLLGLLALPIVLLYMLKLRRREVQVSSTLLWQALLRDRQANTPWQKLKRNLLLFLQLLILAGLVLALARPALFVPVVEAGSMVVLLDGSASMAATDVQPNRFEAARQIVRGLINGLEPGARMTLIQVASQPVVLAAGERDQQTLLRALENARLSGEDAAWETAFALAAGAVPAMNERSASIVILSDGGLPESGLPGLPGDVRYVPIGESGENLAISALALRPSGDRSELYARVSNFGEVERAVILSFYLDNELFHVQTLRVPPGGNQGVSLSDIPASAQIVRAQLSAPSEAEGVAGAPLDALSLDDTAFAVNQANSQRRVLLFTEGNFFLDSLLASLPGLRAYRALPEVDAVGEPTGRFQLPEESFDLYVFDRLLPGSAALNSMEIPEQGNLLMIEPPTNPLFAVTGVFTPTLTARVETHPLTQYLDWSTVSVRQARKVQLPAWAEPLVRAAEGPLVFVGETEGRRVAVLTFDLHESDLPLQIAYPVLFASLMDYLVPAQAFDASGLKPGGSLEILVPPGVEQVAIAAPDNAVYSLAPTQEGFFFSNTQALGVYAVNFLKADSQSAAYFAVNLFSPEESHIQPAAAIQIGRSSVSASGQAELGRRELWPWLGVLAFLVLLIEWWAYHRRLTLPGTGWLSRALQTRFKNRLRAKPGL
jgi:hypothetical protein